MGWKKPHWLDLFSQSFYIKIRVSSHLASKNPCAFASPRFCVVDTPYLQSLLQWIQWAM
jgi:hypothetical protein